MVLESRLGITTISSSVSCLCFAALLSACFCVFDGYSLYHMPWSWMPLDASDSLGSATLRCVVGGAFVIASIVAASIAPGGSFLGPPGPSGSPRFLESFLFLELPLASPRFLSTVRLL